MCLTEIRTEKSNHNDNMRPTLDQVQVPIIAGKMLQC